MNVLCFLVCMTVVTAPWWEDFPRIVETPHLDQALAHHATIGMCAAHTDPGWGVYGQVIARHEERGREFQESGLKSISYAETYGTTYCYIVELAPEAPDADHRALLCSHWNWTKYGGGEIAWVGMHNWFDDEAFARPYTRTHPRYGGPPMTYPDGTPATGYLGSAADPRNNRVYDACTAKDILGGLALEYRFQPKPAPTGEGETSGVPMTGLLPVGDAYVGLVLFCKDSACPLFADYTRASTLMAADHGSDGIWSDNYSAWDSFGIRPVQNAFGDWSVARFRDYLKVHVDTESLAAMGVSGVESFDIRAALRSFMRSIGGDDTNLQDPLWNDPRWLEFPLWRAYAVFKRQTGAEALSRYYHGVKEAAAEAGRPDFLIAGNDLEFMLGWCRGDLDLVSSELSPGWGLATGPHGIPLYPVGRFAPLYKFAREHARSRFVNIWLYLEKEYAPCRLNSAVVNTFYYEMLANHTLPMFHPGNPRIAGTDADNAGFFAFVERAAPEYGARQPVEDIGIFYSSGSVLRTITPGGFQDHGNQHHQFGVWGWATALGELHYQYRIIPEWHCTAKALNALHLLVIPDAQVLEPEWVAAVLKPWLERGGRLMYTGMTGLYRGEAHHFDKNPGGPCLESLKDLPKVRFVVENIGRDYYLLDTVAERDNMRPRFSELVSTLLQDIPARITPEKLPATVGVTLYEDEARSLFFIDLNNMHLNPQADALVLADKLRFSVRLPNWITGREVREHVLAPGPVPVVTLERQDQQTVQVHVESLRVYAGIVIIADDH